jgi:glycosyltransferase involved in cell wall biosynthesis
MENISVCHMVNAVGPTSGPANHAAALVKYTDVEAGILAWFWSEPFDGSEILDVETLEAPDTTLGIDLETYRRATEVLADYDVVHVHHPHSGTFGKLIGRRLGKKLVSTEGSNHDKFTRQGRIGNGLTNVLTDTVTCVSGSVYESFAAWEKAILPDDSVEIVYTGVDIDKIDRRNSVNWRLEDHVSLDTNAITVGTAGRLAEMKAHDTLIRGVAQANSLGAVPVELVIAGDGELRTKLEALARKEGIEDRVHFLGLLDRLEVYRMMDDIDIYAMPSRWEGFSSAVIEAMAIGNPCVLSDIRSFRETFDDVALFHELDDPASLSSQLHALIDDPELRSSLVEEASTLIREKYTMRDTARAYRNLYSRLLDE